MQPAPSVPASDPLQRAHHALIGWQHVAQRLAALGVRLQYAPMLPHELSDFDPTTGTLYIRETAALEDQIWAMQQAWNYIAIGPHASPTARRQPLLRVVPAPREAPDTQSA